MRRNKRLLAVMMAAALVGAAAAGCSPANSESTDAPQTTLAEETGKPEESSEPEESKEAEPADLYVFIAASLKNTMEKIKENYESEHPDINIIYNADSSGTLQTQIEEGARCDIFFSAATKQMNALKDGGYVIDGSITDLLANKIVLIKPAGGTTSVTGFDNITEASSLALAGEDVPVGQYARELFTNMGILDQVMSMEINEGPNVTAVLTAVAEGSNEVGIVYATDAASMADQVEILAEADPEMIDPAVYPVGLIQDEEASDAQVKAAAEFKEYLVEDESVKKLFNEAGFQEYTE